MNFPQFLKNKKICLAGLAIILIGLFLFSASPARAADCGKNQESFSFASFLNPIASLAEKVAKDFGYQISLAAAPDPDTCGSDSVGCSGTTPTATISWTALSGFNYYILTVSGIDSWSTGSNTSYTLSPGYKCPAYNNTAGSIYVCPAPYTCNGQLQTGSTCVGSNHGDPCYWYHTYSCAVWPGLANSTTYSWSVEAYIGNQSSATYGYTNRPYGSFTTPSCLPTLTVDLITNPNSGNAPLGVNIGGTTIGGTATGNVNYYFWRNCANSTTDVSQAKTSCDSFGVNAPANDCSGMNDYWECKNVDPGLLSGFAWQWYPNAGAYTAKLIVERAGLAAQDQENVTVTPPPISTLTVTKAGTGFGTVTPSTGTLSWSGNTGTASYSYNTFVALTASPSAGSAFADWSGCDSVMGNQCNVTMTAAKNVTITFNLLPPPGNFNLSLGGGGAACNSVPLSWTAASGAQAYRILKGAARIDITPYQPYTARNFTDTTVSQNTSYLYQIEAYNAGGTNRSNSIPVSTPYCPPTLNFSAAPTSIYQGQSTTLSWATTYTTSCTASADPAQSNWSGSKELNNLIGQPVVPLPPPSVTYNLTCSGLGGSVSSSVTINIAPLFLPDWREIIPR